MLLLSRSATVLVVASLLIGLYTATAQHTFTNVFSWGENEHAQLGIGYSSPRSFGKRVASPVPAADTSTFTNITSSRAHTLGITRSRALYGWGSSNCGQLGYLDGGIRATPMPLNKMNVLAAAAGPCLSAILNDKGSLHVLNETGWTQIGPSETLEGLRCGAHICVAWRVGNSPILYRPYVAYFTWFDSTGVINDPINFPPSLNSETPLLDVSLGSHHILLRYRQFVDGIGLNSFGQISQLAPPHIIRTSDGENVKSVAACNNYSLILANSKLWALGDIPSQLVCTNTTIMEPCRDFTPHLLVSVSCAGDHIFLLYSSGSILSWGSNESIRGVPSTFPTGDDALWPYMRTPIGAGTFVSLAAPSSSARAMFALTADSTPSAPSTPLPSFFAWGANDQGQLGLGFPSLAEPPTASPFPFVLGSTTLVGTSNTSFALNDGFSKYRDQTNLYILGNSPLSDFDSSNPSDIFPRFVSTGAFQVASTQESVVLVNGTQLQTFGPTQDPASLLATESLSEHPTHLECGYEHCILCRPTTSCTFWGSNLTGQIPASMARSELEHVPLNITDTMLTLPETSFNFSLSKYYTIAYTSTTHKIWGPTFGPPSSMDSPTSWYWTFLGSITTMSSGYNHTLVLGPADSDSIQLNAFGDNSRGQLARTDSSSQPKVIPLPPGYSSWEGIAAIGHTSFAAVSILRNNRAELDIFAWGGNTEHLLLGLPSITHTSTLTRLPISFSLSNKGMTNFRPQFCFGCRGRHMSLIATGIPFLNTQPISLSTTRRISFGDNRFGQLGLGHTESPVLPTATSWDETLLNTSAPDFYASHSPYGSVIRQKSTSWHLVWNLPPYTRSNMEISLPGASWSLSPRSSSTSLISIVSTSNSGQSVLASAVYNGVASIMNFGTNGEWNQLATIPGGSAKIVRSTPASPSTPTPNSPFWIAINDTGSVFSSNAARQSDFTSAISDVLIDPYDEQILGFFLNGTFLFYNNSGSAIGKDLYGVLTIATNYYVLAALRADNSIWTVATRPNETPYTRAMLGRTTGDVDQWGIVRVSGPCGNLIQLACNIGVCYALDHVGMVFAWGNGVDYAFGENTAVSVYPTPRVISWTSLLLDATSRNLIIPPTQQVVKLTTDTWKSVHLWTGPRTASVDSLRCQPLPAPTSNSICVNGKWLQFQPIYNSTFNVDGTLVVYNNITLDSLTLGGLNSSLSAFGCAFVNGQVTVVLSQADIDEILATGGTRALTLIQARCGSTSGDVLVVGNDPCHSVSADKQEHSEGDSYQLSAVFKVTPTGRCNSKDQEKANRIWWIILVSVIGGVILIVLIIAILSLFTPLRRKIRPFTRRADRESRT